VIFFGDGGVDSWESSKVAMLHLQCKTFDIINIDTPCGELQNLRVIQVYQE
jgi:hypothetical protein